MSSDQRSTMPEVNEAFVRSKTRYFTDTQVWPRHDVLDIDGWLRNFSQDELQFGVHLLNAFTYFPNSFMDSMFVAAFHGLSQTISRSTQRREDWERFCVNTIITMPTGEQPTMADSGYLFARRARDLLGLSSDQLMAPEVAIQAIESGFQGQVVFVDDFVGSGEQFWHTWHRPYGDVSFNDLTNSECRYFYIPLVCTRYALANRLNSLTGKVNFLPLHVIDSEYSLLAEDSILWPKSMRSDGQDFVRRKSHELGLPDTNGQHVNDWQGFHALGLALAFEHKIPDASIPLFYLGTGGWNPLWRKPV